MVKGQLLGRQPAAAILTGEAVAQEDVEASERRSAAEHYIVIERDNARQANRNTRRMNLIVVFGNHIDAAHEHRLDGILPGPQRQREVT